MQHAQEELSAIDYYASIRLTLEALGWTDDGKEAGAISKGDYFIYNLDSLMVGVFVNKWAGSSGYIHITRIRNIAAMEPEQLAKTIDMVVSADEIKKRHGYDMPAVVNRRWHSPHEFSLGFNFRTGAKVGDVFTNPDGSREEVLAIID